MIDDGRDAVVRGDFQKVRLKLLTLADVDRVHVVRQAGFFEKQGDLVAVGGGPVIQVDHGELQSRNGLACGQQTPASGRPVCVR
ncbi:hypothetical protein D3C81_2142010 [compost metagenome]